MKKLCLIAIFGWAVALDVGAVSVDWMGGLQISVPCVDGRVFWNGEDFSYGIGFNSSKLNKTFPVQARWGKLSAGGGLSKLNNPLISSSVSPFSSTPSSISPITASFSSSFNKGDTFFLQAGYNGKGTLQKITLNCYYDSNGELFSPFGNVFTSSMVSFNLPQKKKLSAELTFGSFMYNGLKSDSWYSDDAFYHEGRGNSAVGQVLFSDSNFSTVFTGGFYLSPFGELKTIFKTENKVKIKKSVIGLSLLYNPSHNLLTSSGKVIDECLQSKISFQYQFRNGKTFPIFWKTGFTGFYERNLTEDEDILKFALGLQMVCFVTNVSFTAQSDFNVISPGGKVNFTKGTLTLKNQFYFLVIQPGVKLSASFTPSSNYTYLKTSENCTLYLSFCENPAISLQSSVTFNQRTGQQKGETPGTKFDFSGTVKFKWKWLQCTGKVSVNLTS